MTDWVITISSLDLTEGRREGEEETWFFSSTQVEEKKKKNKKKLWHLLFDSFNFF